MRIRPKLQELVQQEKDCLIDIYYGDESHICTEGYVPYGWRFRGEDVYIPSERGLRLNIFGMIDRNNRYEGFSTTENMTADKVADFLDRFSLRIRKNTFVVLDNASVHRCKLMRELRQYGRNVGCISFPSTVQSTFEYRRDALENPQGQMAQTCGLLLHRIPALCN